MLNPLMHKLAHVRYLEQEWSEERRFAILLNDSDNQVLPTPKVKWGSCPIFNELYTTVLSRKINQNAVLAFAVFVAYVLPLGPDYHGKLPALFKSEK